MYNVPDMYWSSIEMYFYCGPKYSISISTLFAPTASIITYVLQSPRTIKANQTFLELMLYIHNRLKDIWTEKMVTWVT